MKLLTLLAAAAALAGPASGAMTPAGTAQAPADFDLLITNGRIINGTGNPWFRADIGIRGDTIAEIGNLGGRTAVRTVDVRGQVVAPGFIDMHTHVDDAFDSDDANAILNYLIQGVTTVRTGSDGSGSSRVAETKARWETGGIGTNAVMMVPFNVIRREVMGRDNLRPASPDEIERMRAIVRQGMSEGAWGVSTGLEYDGLNVYASTAEVIEVTEPVAEFGGVYISHMRDEAGSILEAADEIIRISEGAGVPVQITHLKAAGRDNWGEMRRVVDMVNEARARGVRVTADQYPFLQGAPIDFITDLIDIPDDLGSLTALRRLMRRSEFNAGVSQSDRNAARRAFVVALQQALGGEATRARLRESTYEPRPADPSAVARWGWQDFRIKVTDRHPELLERTLDELVDEQGRDGFDIVADLILDEPDMLFASASQSPDDMRHAMIQDWVMISSDGGGFAPVAEDDPPVRAHPRSFASQSVALRRYVREEGLLALADAVRKMTSLPAQFLGMKDRGLLLEGFKADVVVFDPETISDHATYADAHRYASGVELVLVNGVVAIEEGRHTGALAGRVLLKTAGPDPGIDESGSDAAFDEVRREAETVEENDLGYWEADLGDGHILVYVPAGPFDMGSGDGEPFEQPVHTVELSGYWIGKFPITVAQFRAFVADTGYTTDAERGEGCWVEQPGELRYDANWQAPYLVQREDEPVLCVSWNDAIAYAAWMSALTGLRFTLPTEAQWEKAARGTDGRPYPWGDVPPDGTQANFADAGYADRLAGRRNPSADIDDGYAQSSPVGAYPAGRSPYGVYDLAGNTIDWLYDWFDDTYYAVSPVTNPIGPSRNPTRHKFSIPGGWGSNLQRSIRGGAWTDASGQLSLEEGGHSIRSDRRESTDQYSSDDHMSFRMAIDTSRPRIDPRAELEAVTVPDERAVVVERIGDADVMFQYRRSAVAGREEHLFGTDVPYGEPWSIGAPNPALFSSNRDVLLEGQHLAAGTYAMEIVPEEFRDGASRWTLVLRDWRGRAGTGAEALRVRTHAQLEDNSKEHLEVFFDTRPDRGVIARVLWEYVEVHIALSHGGQTDAEDHVASEPTAMVMNSVGQSELALFYRRQVAETAPLFGDHVPFDEVWNFGDEGVVLEARGDLIVGGERVRAGRYDVTLVPHADRSWSFTASPLPGGSLDRISVSLEAAVDTGTESLARLEFYFDHTPEGTKVLVMAWGNKTARLTVEDPAADRL